jgi:hypothetical protein
MTVMGLNGYRVIDTRLICFPVSGASTTVGTIPGHDRCIFANDGTTLVIVDPGNAVYFTDGVTVTVSTDVNIAGAIAVTFLNGTIIYTKPDLIAVANVGDPTTVNALNQIGAESQPDDLVRCYAYSQMLYAFGVKSTEPFWYTDSGQPPLSRIEGQIVEVGCAATHSVAHTDEALYWLGDDFCIYRVSGGVKQRISTTAISNELKSYSDVSDAVAYTLTFQGMNFYIINFIAGNKTWALNEGLGKAGWFNLSGDADGGVYPAHSYINILNDNYLCDKTEGWVYKLDQFTYVNGKEVPGPSDIPIYRKRTTGVIDGKILGAPAARVQMSRLEILMEKGVGLIQGQGEDPKIIIDVSYDLGRSWVAKGFARIGRAGEFTLKVELHCLDTFYSAIFRITTSDPVQYSIYSATADLRLAGW